MASTFQVTSSKNTGQNQSQKYRSIRAGTYLSDESKAKRTVLLRNLPSLDEVDLMTLFTNILPLPECTFLDQYNMGVLHCYNEDDAHTLIDTFRNAEFDGEKILVDIYFDYAQEQKKVTTKTVTWHKLMHGGEDDDEIGDGMGDEKGGKTNKKKVYQKNIYHVAQEELQNLHEDDSEIYIFDLPPIVPQK